MSNFVSMRAADVGRGDKILLSPAHPGHLAVAEFVLDVDRTSATGRITIYTESDAFTCPLDAHVAVEVDIP